MPRRFASDFFRERCPGITSEQVTAGRCKWCQKLLQGEMLAPTVTARVYESEAFKRGYERGRQYLEAFRKHAS